MLTLSWLVNNQFTKERSFISSEEGHLFLSKRILRVPITQQHAIKWANH